MNKQYRYIKVRISDASKMTLELEQKLLPGENVVSMVEDGPSVLLLVRVGK